MKFVFTSLFALLASTAFACPDLSGTYSCNGENGPESVTFSQAVLETGITVYTVTDKDGPTQMPADNVEYPFNDPSENMTGTARFTCEDDSFNAYMKGQATDSANKVVQTWDIVRGAKLTAEKNLEVSFKGTWTDNNQLHPVNDVAVCNRQ